MNSLPRERKCAVTDKKKSYINYIKSNNNDENTQEALKRLSSHNLNLNIEEQIKNINNEDLPLPPVHSNLDKQYINENNNNVNN